MNYPMEGYEKVVSMQTSTGSFERVCTFEETGQMTLETCERHIETMVSCSQQEDCHRFLVDLTETRFVASIAAQYELAYERAERLGLRRSWKIALLVTPDDGYDFLAVVSQNAGYSLRCFDEQRIAIEWLID